MSDDRHQQRQQRLKEQVDARVAAARDERGILIVLPATAKAKPPPHLGYRHPRQSDMGKSGRDPVYQG